jgi:hypothetical protein
MFDFDEYNSPKEMTLEEYNLQPMEVDAHAYGSLVTASMFNLEPIFQGLPDSVRIAARKRRQEIINERTK